MFEQPFLIKASARVFRHHFALLLLFVTCANGRASLSSDEEVLVKGLGFDPVAMNSVKALGSSLERLMGRSVDFQRVPAAGVVLLTKPNEGHTVLIAVRRVLAGSSYSAYLNEQAFGHGPDRVAIMKTSDPYAYLAVVRTDGVNYDIDHAQVIARYRELTKRYGLLLVGAGQDWLEAKFSRQPEDWKVFAKEVYAFCPDIVDQGTGTVEALAHEMRRTNTIYLWWD